MRTLLFSCLMVLSVSSVADVDSQIRQLSESKLQEMVDYCDDTASKRVMDDAAVMACSIAYDELVHHRFGSYKSYINRDSH